MAGNKSDYKKVMYVHSEMVAARHWAPSTRPDDLDSVMLSLKHKDGGCKWEFEVELMRLGGKGAMRVKLFSDSWIAIKEAPEAFEVFAEFQDKHDGDDTPRWPLLLKALEKAGWERFVAPEKEAAPPTICQSCGLDHSGRWKLENENDMKSRISRMFKADPTVNECDVSTDLNVSLRTAARLVDELIAEGRLAPTPSSLDRK